MSLAPRLIALAAAATLLAPAVAHAEPVLGGSQIQFEFNLKEDADSDFAPISSNDTEFLWERQFNLSRCYCGQAGTDDYRTQFGVQFSFDPALTGSVTDTVHVWLGVDCLDPEPTLRHCGIAPQHQFEDADNITSSPMVTFNVYELHNADTMRMCGKSEYTAGVYAAPTPDGNTTYDATESFNAEIFVDTQPPPVPSAFERATGSEDGVYLDWEPIEENEEDIYKWQVLCARVDAAGTDGVVPAFDEPKHDPAWETAEDLCNATTTETYIVDPPADLPSPLLSLDAAYVCGEADGAVSDIRIDGLENGEEYWVVLLAVDQARNVAGIAPAGVLTPQPVVDFWEDLHANDSEVEGGFCLIAQAYGDGGPITDALRGFRDGTLARTALGRWLIGAYYDAGAPLAELARDSMVARVVLAVLLVPLVVLALLWHALTLPGLIGLAALLILWRRRRRLVIAAAITLAPAAASAQSFAPYWEDETDVEDDGLDDVKWHAGIKMGPYIPAIDAQAGTGADGMGPYERMYGGWEVLPVLEVDRFIWHPTGGQLGIGGSIGVMGKTANAFRFIDEDGDNEYDVGEMIERSKGDRTKFRLVPVAANVIYRLTMLDDEWGVPVIPYLRGGVSYYIWWNTKPNGDVSVLSDGNKARGATLGLQGSLGLAIRAENIDRTAAASMRDGGIYHAGFYAEYQLGWVDGFGSEKKLAVGDNTWFAGVDFEF